MNQTYIDARKKSLRISEDKIRTLDVSDVVGHEAAEEVAVQPSIEKPDGSDPKHPKPKPKP